MIPNLKTATSSYQTFPRSSSSESPTLTTPTTSNTFTQTSPTPSTDILLETLIQKINDLGKNRISPTEMLENLQFVKRTWSSAVVYEVPVQAKIQELCRKLIHCLFPLTEEGATISLADGDLKISAAQLEVLKLEFNLFDKAFENTLKENNSRQIVLPFLNKGIFSTICAICIPEEQLDVYPLEDSFNPREMYQALDYLGGLNKTEKILEFISNQMGQENFYQLLQLIIEAEIKSTDALPPSFVKSASKKFFQLLVNRHPISAEDVPNFEQTFQELLEFIKANNLKDCQLLVDTIHSHMKGHTQNSVTFLYPLLGHLQTLDVPEITRLSIIGFLCHRGQYEHFLHFWRNGFSNDALEIEIANFIRIQLTEKGTKPDLPTLLEGVVTHYAIYSEFNDAREEGYYKTQLVEPLNNIKSFTEASYNSDLSKFNVIISEYFIQNLDESALNLFIHVNRHDPLSYGAFAVSISKLNIMQKLNIIQFFLRIETENMPFKIFRKSLLDNIFTSAGSDSDVQAIFYRFLKRIQPFNFEYEPHLIKIFLENAENLGIELSFHKRDTLQKRLKVLNRQLPKYRHDDTFTKSCRRGIDAVPGEKTSMIASENVIVLLHRELQALKAISSDAASLYLNERLYEVNLSLFSYFNNFSLQFNLLETTSDYLNSETSTNLIITLILRSQIYLAMNRLEEAEKDFLLLEKYLPKLHHSWGDEDINPITSGLAYIHGVNGRFDEAYKLFEKVFNSRFEFYPVSIERFMTIYNQHPHLQLKSSNWNTLFLKIQKIKLEDPARYIDLI